MPTPFFRTGIGQDSHRFLPEDSTKPCVIAGIVFNDTPGFKANSDGDLVLHAIINAISSLTGEIILGTVADELLEKHGITDSAVFLKKALLTLKNQKIFHVALSLEGRRPLFLPRIGEMKRKLASLLTIQENQVGITATTGEGLTDFGCGDGVQCFAIVTTVEMSVI